MSTQSIERPPLNDLTNVEAWRLLNHAQTRRDDAKRDRDGWARAIADSIARSAVGGHVLIVGHPFVDIWQAVKPGRLGLPGWPEVPRSEEWKKGVCQRLGWPHRDQADIARAWRHILGGVRGYQDLEPELLGRVEELIDFVTAPSPGRPA